MLTGFELNVGVVFIDDFPPEMRESKPECRFTFRSGEQKRGMVSNVPYDLPGNSTCTYSFQENYFELYLDVFNLNIIYICGVTRCMK